MVNIDIHDNGAAYCIRANGIIVHTENSLGNAWRHIQWMYDVASQEFTVGEQKTPVREWLTMMMKAGYMNKRHYDWMN